MDLYNNEVGRRLAHDPANEKRDAAEVILEAIADGQLRIIPFNAEQGHRSQKLDDLYRETINPAFDALEDPIDNLKNRGGRR